MDRLSSLGISLLLITSPLAAQDAASSPQTAAPCSYDACALRVEEGRVLRGVTGEEVGRFGFLRAPRLLPLVGPSDSARFYATEFDRHYTAGTRWSFLGTLTGAAATVYLIDRSHHRASNDWRGGDWVAVGGLVLSLGVTSYGERRVLRAGRGLSRAIWWHNRALSR